MRKSWITVDRRIMMTERLSYRAKILYVILLGFTRKNRDGELRCWPGRDLLCDILNWNEHTIAKYLRELRAVGLVTWHQERRGGRLGKRIYTLSEELTEGGNTVCTLTARSPRHRKYYKRESMNKGNNESRKDTTHSPNYEAVASTTVRPQPTAAQRYFQEAGHDAG